MLKLSFKCFALGILIGSLLFFYYRSSSSHAAPLRVVVAAQPGAPLLILATFVDAGNPIRPRYGYSITNTTDKAIVAYAIQESVSLDPTSSIVTTTLAHMPARTLWLGPHDSRQEESGGKTYEKAPIEVNLTVDFVEFEDGTKWGEDKIKSAERLDGERAGGRAALKKYREILVANGVDALLEEAANPKLIEPENINGKSSNWVDGFKMGVSVVKSRMATAETKGGKDGIRRELAKPYDSTEGRLEPW